MAITQAKIDALECAIAEGVLKVKYEDREVTYRSLDEMMRTLDWMKNQFDPTRAKPKRIKYSTNKALC